MFNLAYSNAPTRSNRSTTAGSATVPAATDAATVIYYSIAAAMVSNVQFVSESTM